MHMLFGGEGRVGVVRQCGCGRVVRGGVGGERERKEKVTSQ